MEGGKNESLALVMAELESFHITLASLWLSSLNPPHVACSYMFIVLCWNMVLCAICVICVITMCALLNTSVSVP